MVERDLVPYRKADERQQQVGIIVGIVAVGGAALSAVTLLVGIHVWRVEAQLARLSTCKIDK